MPGSLRRRPHAPETFLKLPREPNPAPHHETHSPPPPVLATVPRTGARRPIAPPAAAVGRPSRQPLDGDPPGPPGCDGRGPVVVRTPRHALPSADRGLRHPGPGDPLGDHAQHQCDRRGAPPRCRTQGQGFSGPPAWSASCAQGPVRHPGHAHHLRVPADEGLTADPRRHGRPAPARWRCHHPREGQYERLVRGAQEGRPEHRARSNPQPVQPGSDPWRVERRHGRLPGGGVRASRARQ